MLIRQRGPPAMARLSIHSWREPGDDQIVPSAVEFFQSSPHRGDVRHTIEADWSGDEVRARAFVRGFHHQNSLPLAQFFSNFACTAENLTLQGARVDADMVP